MKNIQFPISPANLTPNSRWQITYANERLEVTISYLGRECVVWSEDHFSSPENIDYIDEFLDRNPVRVNKPTIFQRIKNFFKMKQELDLQFWQQTDEDFKASNYAYICNTSPAFKSAWSNEGLKSSIRALAEEFFKDSVFRQDHIICDKDALFEAHGWSKHRSIRLAFIQWNIDRLTPTT